MLKKDQATATKITPRAEARRAFVVAFAFLIFFASSLPVFAQAKNTAVTNQLNQVGAATGLGGTDLVTIIGRIINIALGFVGIVLLAFTFTLFELIVEDCKMESNEADGF